MARGLGFRFRLGLGLELGLESGLGFGFEFGFEFGFGGDDYDLAATEVRRRRRP